MAEFKVGDRVTVNDRKWPGVFEVIKVNPVNLKLRPLAGGRNLNCHPMFLTLHTGPDPEITKTAAGTAETVPLLGRPYQKPLGLGAVVTTSAPLGGKPGTSFFVVIKVGDGTYNLAPLGGFPGANDRLRYYRSVPESLLTEVDREVLTKALASL